MYTCIDALAFEKNLSEFTHSKLLSSRYSDDLLLFLFVCRTVSPGSSINYSKFIMSVKLGIKWTVEFKKKITSILLDILTDKVCCLDKQGTMFLNCKIHNPRVMDHGIGVGCHWSYIKNRANKLRLTRLFKTHTFFPLLLHLQVVSPLLELICLDSLKYILFLISTII